MTTKPTSSASSWPAKELAGRTRSSRQKNCAAGHCCPARAAGGVWAVMTGQVTWPAWLPTDMSAMLVSSIVGAPAPVALAAPAPRAARTVAVASKPNRQKNLAAVEAPSLSPRSAPDQPGCREHRSADCTADDRRAPARRQTLRRRTQTATCRPAIADPSDPYQVRAAAVGLHPDLSRALLARLSPSGLPQCGHRHQDCLGRNSRDGRLRLAAPAQTRGSALQGPLRPRRRGRLPALRRDRSPRTAG